LKRDEANILKYFNNLLLHLNPHKPWLEKAASILRHALSPIPTEPNELDWKSGLSPQKQRLTEHLSAFANHPAGGFLVFGTDSSTATILGVSPNQASDITGRLANLGRDALEPPVTIDHAVMDWDGASLLFVHIPEQPVKPVHLRGKDLQHAWIRSGGTTRKASHQDIGALMLNSRTPRWENLRACTRLSLDEAVERLDAVAIAKLLQRPLPEGGALAAWMAEENLLELDGDGAYVTNFGAIAAARDLRQFEPLDRKGVRLIRYRGLNKVETIEEQLGRKGYALGLGGLVRQLKTDPSP